MEARPDPVRPSVEPAELWAVFSSLGHELGRPLDSLRAGFDRLLGDPERPVSPNQRGHIQTMSALCEDLRSLTEGYLDFVGLVQGARPPRPGSYSLGALVDELGRQFTRPAETRRIAWDCLLEGPDAELNTDAAHCQQLFSNLVDNALKSTPEGGLVRLTARRDGAWWCVTVSDTGPGIPTECLGQVFEPLFRLPRDERAGIAGHGLGLAICRVLVDRLGGEITIRPGPDQGTRVVVRLPIEAPTPHDAAR